MARFRRRPEEVEAEQWQPGKAIDGLSTRDEYVFSRDGRYFYVDKLGWRPTHWLSVEKFPGPVAEENKHAQWEGYVQYTVDGQTYHRRSFSFAFFKIDSGERRPTNVADEIFKDFAAAEGWDESCSGPPRKAILRSGETDAKIVEPGDWIVWVGDRAKVMSAAKFAATYEEIL